MSNSGLQGSQHSHARTHIPSQNLLVVFWKVTLGDWRNSELEVTADPGGEVLAAKA